MNSTVKNCPQICLVTDPLMKGRGVYILKNNLILLLESLTEKKVQVIEANYNINSSRIPIRIARVILIQFKNTYYILKVSKNNDIYFFTMGAHFFFPMLVAKLLKKKTVYFVSGLAGGHTIRKVMKIIYKDSLYGVGRFLFPPIFSYLEYLNYKLSDVLIVESTCLANQIALDKNNNKHIFNGALFVDIKTFSPKISYSERLNKVCYFGAITEHKGANNFIKAIPMVLALKDNVQFVFGGSGDAIMEIEKFLREMDLITDPRVVFAGKISHSEMPHYLNKAKLVVLPSYGEGLPNIVLEAMACGTPVIATAVGGIPDVITDYENGFILESNTPECIAKNIIKAIEYPHLEQVSKNARVLIESEYTYEKAVERYRHILDKI